MSDPHRLIRRIAAIAPKIHDLGAEAEKLRHLPDELSHAMIEAELFGILLPRSLGGLELDLIDALGILEEVAAIDGAAGWCLLKGSSSNQLAGFVAPKVAREIWSSPRTVVAGTFAPKGRAVRATGGWHLSGRWDWGTATTFADWLLAGAFLFEEDAAAPIAGPQGPASLVFFIPKAEAVLHDTWHVHGMRGTGSVEFSIEKRFVPDRLTFHLATLEPQESGALYARVPFVAQLMVPHAPVAIGIARAAVEALIALARGKTPLASRTLLKDKSWVQDLVARATAEVDASRALLYHAVRLAWEAPTFTPDLGVRLSLAATHATHRCARAVDWMYEAAGGTAVFEASPLQRHFRDIHVAASHFLVNRERYAGAGRMIFGDSLSAVL